VALLEKKGKTFVLDRGGEKGASNGEKKKNAPDLFKRGPCIEIIEGKGKKRKREFFLGKREPAPEKKNYFPMK